MAPALPVRLSQAEVDAVFRLLAERMPGRTPDAKGPKGQPDHFRTLVACLLSAQSRDTNTALAAEALFARADTPEGISALDEGDIAEAIRPCGLYNAKARNLKRLVAELIARHGGAVPGHRAALMQLPGIGRKCADIVLSFCFERPVIAVDTHVFRVSNRIGITQQATADRTAEELEARAPDWALRDGHFWLIQFGKSVCLARRPLCEACFLSGHCLAIRRAGLP